MIWQNKPIDKDRFLVVQKLRGRFRYKIHMGHSTICSQHTRTHQRPIKIPRLSKNREL